MKVKIIHNYSDDQGKTWEKQIFIYKNVLKVESEYQPENGNSNWLIIHTKDKSEYIEFEQDHFSYDEMEIE